MARGRVLVVEDERIIARDIENSLENLGYQVVAVVTTGEEAIERADTLRPDAVLMDIFLKGEMSGVEAAEEIQKRFPIPIIYLTAHTDENTLRRAKVTEPYGYILKPFDEKELQVTLEMALYKHQMQTKLKESQEWLLTTLRSIGEAVIAADTKGRVVLMNPAAESLTGWKQGEAAGKSLEDILRMVEDETGKPVPSQFVRVLREGRMVKSETLRLLVSKDGSKRVMEESGTPIRNDSGIMIGAMLIFRETPRAMAKEVRARQRTAKPIDILLVEDNAVEARLATEGLKKSKILNRVSVAEDGREALAFLRREGKYFDKALPDLILLDLTLPQKDGREVLQEIKKDPGLANIPVMILAASPKEEEMLKGSPLQADGFLTKPVTMEQILRVVATIESFGLAVIKNPAAEA